MTLTGGTGRMLIALVAGFAVGVAASIWPSPAFHAVITGLEPIGKLWVNALQMTVIPLVVSLLITGTASLAERRTTGRLGVVTFVVFLALLVGAGLIALILGPPLLAHIPIDPATTAALARSSSAAVAETAKKLPSFAQLLIDVIPVNPVRAAADGAMLPLSIFAILLGLAVIRITPEQRDLFVRFFRALGDAMLVLVRWVILVAPIGVLALSAGLTSRTGLGAVRALALYIVLLSGILILVTLFLYPLAASAGGVSLGRFLRAAAQPQAVALSARSSLAALPAMVESARDKLALPAASTGFVLPLAVSVLRLSTPVVWAVTIPFLARLYGVNLGTAQLIWLVAIGIVLSPSTPGLPSASLFLITPFLPGLGIPVEGLGIVIAADAIPDLCKGVLNVTGHLAATAIVDRHTDSARNRPEE